MRMWSWVALGAVLSALTACGPADECKEGETRACYTGPVGTKGVGLCQGGVERCVAGQWAGACEGEVKPVAETCDAVDNDCDGTPDNGVQNACGGCQTLEQQPAEACERCGTVACDGTESTTCTANPKIGESCTGDNGCAGAWACGANGLECQAAAKNACGKCGGPAVANVGDSCTGAAGCAGTLACNADGTATVCQAPAKNACGVCGGQDVTGVGGACQSQEGCTGALACNADGSGTECHAPAKNACGVCGGPAIASLGDACGGAGGVCAGHLVCNADGTGTKCDGPAPNNCGVCGAPDVAGVGGDCVADGCDTKFTCTADGSATQCVAQPKNACGVCGGPAVTGLGDACKSADGCDGTQACNSAGTAAACNAPAKNACGVCGGATVTGVGDACKSADGCDGKNVCNGAGDAVSCNAPAKNACGVCGGATVTGVGDACEGANGCAGTLACNTAGTGTVCSNVPSTCSSPTCNGQPAPGLGTTCTADNGTRGVKVCDATNGLVCKGADAGGARIVISEIATGTTASASDEYVELYNASNAAIDVSAYVLYYRSASSSSTWANSSIIGKFAAGTTIPAGGYFLFAHANYTGTGTKKSDRPYENTSTSMSSTGGQIWLMKQAMTSGTPSLSDPATQAALSDMVGFGSAAIAEGMVTGSPAPTASAPPDGQSIERKAYASSTAASMMSDSQDGLRGNAQDSNNNKADFVVRTTRDPQNSQSLTEP